MIKVQIYDYLESLEAEVRESVSPCFGGALPPVYLVSQVDLIWRAKWGSGKILFLLARYPTIIQMAVATYCACIDPVAFACQC